MMFSKVNHAETTTKEYVVHGCQKPTELNLSPQVYTSTVFEKDIVHARASFIRLMKRQQKIKSNKLLILKVEEIEQPDDFKFRNYGINYLYRTKAGVQKGYKESRHLNKVLAVDEIIYDISKNQKVKRDNMKIVEVKELSDEEVTKLHILPFLGKDVSFPVFSNRPNTKEKIVRVGTDLFN